MCFESHDGDRFPRSGILTDEEQKVFDEIRATLRMVQSARGKKISDALHFFKKYPDYFALIGKQPTDIELLTNNDVQDANNMIGILLSRGHGSKVLIKARSQVNSTKISLPSETDLTVFAAAS